MLRVWTACTYAVFSPQGIMGGCILGGVTNHIKALKLHPLYDQRELNTKSTLGRTLKYTYMYNLKCISNLLKHSINLSMSVQ